MQDYLLKTNNARHLYETHAKALPIIDFHNHVSVEDIAQNRQFENLTELWLASDPYKHRLMRICGVPEQFITGDADPYDKFQKYCQVFPYLAGNPVYDWSRMELCRIFGIRELPSREYARRIYDAAGEMLGSPEFSNNGILDRFHIEYQSPVAQLTDDLTPFNGKTVAPSLRGDDLLAPTPELKKCLGQETGIAVADNASYISAVSVLLDRFQKAGCRFADHALDADFFEAEDARERTERLIALAGQYARRGWTLLLHIGAKRKTSPRLAALAGPAGGYAATGSSFAINRVAELLGEMEAAGGLPDTVLFPLNMSDQAAFAVMQGSFSQDGVSSKVQLGPAWWWCDHAMGIENALSCIASFGVVSQFIGMTTDSRSILSFVRHDYFRRLLCSWLDRQNKQGQWALSPALQGEIIEKICYGNVYEKIHRR